MEETPLRYLGAADVEVCLPPIEERITLAGRALVALARDEAEMPPKIGVHPRPGALLHAMPAWLRDEDVVGLKWVGAFPENRARGLPAIAALVILNDPATGRPTCVMDGTVITAARTAAVSGVAIRTFRPGARRVAIIGAGVQARSHLEMLASLLTGFELTIYDRHMERAERLAEAARTMSGVASAEAARDARGAAADAQVVITVATLGSGSQRMGPEWVEKDALVVAVDFATYASAELARAAASFAVDDRGQFLAYRDQGYFDGYPDPDVTLGEAWAREAGGEPADASSQAPRSSLALVTHLGVGLADVVFADAILARAAARGIGMELPR
jgi:ornithine cyclodeaminase/alanine dehydrogenase-like protein (mu-crystallin family)